MSYVESEAARNSAVEAVHFMDPDDAGQEATRPSTGDGLFAGAAQGALSGGIVGGVMATLGLILMPGVVPTIAEGLLGTVLAAAGLGAAAGGIIGALVRAEDVARETRANAVHEPRATGFWEGEDRRSYMSFSYAGPERRFSFG